MRHNVISAALQCSACYWSLLLRIGFVLTSATDTSVTTIEKSTYTYCSTGHTVVKLYIIRVNLLVIRSNLSRVSIIPLFRCFLSCSWVFSTLPLCCVLLCLCTNSGRHRCLSTLRNPRGFNQLIKYISLCEWGHGNDQIKSKQMAQQGCPVSDADTQNREGGRGCAAAGMRVRACRPGPGVRVCRVWRPCPCNRNTNPAALPGPCSRPAKAPAPAPAHAS